MLNLIISLALITNIMNQTPYIEVKENIDSIKNEIKTEIELKEDNVTLLCFCAAWCKPCQRLAPVIDKLKETYQCMDIMVINVDKNANMVKEYGVKGYPTTIIYKNGVEQERVLGFIEEDKLMEKILKEN